MSVYHCPLCPLIFQFRPDVQRHLREEHRFPAGGDGGMPDGAPVGRELDADLLNRLRGSMSGPAVTVLLGTAPAAAMTVLDVARLRQLAERARRRLAGELRRDPAVGVVGGRLSSAVSAAESRGTDRGLAILVNPEEMAVIALPFAPRDRQVVAPGFATRDLDYALRRFPRYRVLVLGTRPRILEGWAHRLSEPAGASAGPDTDALLEERVQAAGDLPLVVVGDRRSLDRFHRCSVHARDVLTEVVRPRFHRAGVADLVAGGLDRVHRAEHSRAVADLIDAETRSGIAWGVHPALRAVQDGTARRLWVEHDYAVPGHPVAGDHGPADPAEVDDMVEVLLAGAAARAVPVHLLDRGALGRPEPVAVEAPSRAAVNVPGSRLRIAPRAVTDNPLAEKVGA